MRTEAEGRDSYLSQRYAGRQSNAGTLPTCCSCCSGGGGRSGKLYHCARRVLSQLVEVVESEQKQSATRPFLLDPEAKEVGAEARVHRRSSPTLLRTCDAFRGTWAPAGSPRARKRGAGRLV